RTGLALTSVQAPALGAYTVTVTNSSGSVTSAPASLGFAPLLVVTNPYDWQPGSLRQALLDANAGGPADRRDILLTNLTGVIPLYTGPSNSLPPIAVNTVITGPGADRLSIIFYGSGLAFSPGTTNVLAGLTLAGSQWNTGALVTNAGTLT